MTEDIRNTIITAVNSFPTVSDVAGKVLRLLREECSDFDCIEKTVGYDPEFADSVLRMANSAYFRLPNRVSSIRQSIACLGWKRMFHLVMVSAANGIMQDEVRSYGLRRGELWRQAIAASVAAERIMRLHNIRAADEAYTAALLRDVGKLVLGDFVESYAAAIELALLSGATFEAAEREVLGMDHAEAGACILRNWSLPDYIVEAVQNHHDPDASASPNMLVDVVHVADVLAAEVTDRRHEGQECRPSEGSMKRLKLTDADLDAAETSILAGIGELGEMLKADMPQDVESCSGEEC